MFYILEKACFVPPPPPPFALDSDKEKYFIRLSLNSSSLLSDAQEAPQSDSFRKDTCGESSLFLFVKHLSYSCCLKAEKAENIPIAYKPAPRINTKLGVPTSSYAPQPMTGPKAAPRSHAEA